MALLAALALCQPASARSDDDDKPNAELGASEELQFVGTEIAWNGQVSAGRMVYKTQVAPAGESVPVQRAVGSGGVLFMGDLAQGSFIMLVKPGDCRDGLTGRNYPFTVEFRFAGSTLKGCGWSARRPYRG